MGQNRVFWAWEEAHTERERVVGGGSLCLAFKTVDMCICAIMQRTDDVRPLA